jgi:hypothetical protein
LLMIFCMAADGVESPLRSGCERGAGDGDLFSVRVRMD